MVHLLHRLYGVDAPVATYQNYEVFVSGLIVGRFLFCFATVQLDSWESSCDMNRVTCTFVMVKTLLFYNPVWLAARCSG